MSIYNSVPMSRWDTMVSSWSIAVSVLSICSYICFEIVEHKHRGSIEHVPL